MFDQIHWSKKLVSSTKPPESPSFRMNSCDLRSTTHSSRSRLASFKVNASASDLREEEEERQSRGVTSLHRRSTWGAFFSHVVNWQTLPWSRALMGEAIRLNLFNLIDVWGIIYFLVIDVHSLFIFIQFSAVNNSQRSENKLKFQTRMHQIYRNEA